MALFGVKRRKDGPEKSSPPQKEVSNGRLEASSNPDPNPITHHPNPNPNPPYAIRSNPNQHAPSPSSSTNPQAQPAFKPSTPQPSTVIYPWSHRRLGLLPPAPFPGDLTSGHPGSAHLRPSPPPFPRYGHSVNAMGTPTGSGDLYIFAGLVKDQVKNDLYVLNIAPTPPPNASSPVGSNSAQLHNQILPIGLVETRGEVPLPRVGHASVGVGNVLIVWGGDTKTSEEEAQDDGLYLLNLSTREWTRVKIAGACPEGRYGHSAAIVGSKFFIFGGQTDNGGFMNDLWSFDLHKLKSGAPKWQLIEGAPNAPVPTRRTGHTVVTHTDSIFVFGGTDGQYHYNDTWRFDTTTGLWKELDCIGYIPLPREGHSATLVDDVMYVLGGRGVDGKDLDDLAAFKISNQRWYMFQNMGPAPTGRSGHSMASWQGKVYVLGGESYTSPRPDDPTIVHVLDTGKIKYPPDPAVVARQQMQTVSQKTSQSNLHSPPPSNGPRTNGATGLQQAPRAHGSPASPDSHQQQQAEYRNAKRATTGVSPNPPSRPRRDDDPPLANGQVPQPGGQMNRRTMGSSTTTTRTMSPSSSQPGIAEPVSRRSMSPVVLSHSKNPSLDQSFRASPTANKPPRPPPSHTNNLLQHVGGASQPQSQSSSPSTRRVSSEVVRILNNSSPSTSLRKHAVEQAAVNQHQRHLSGLSHSIAEEQQQRLLHKRNLWLRAALTMAIKQGFVLPSGEGEEEEEEGNWLKAFRDGSSSGGEKGKEWGRLVEGLVQLKRELAKAKDEIVEQAKSVDERVLEATRTKTAAFQEASFYRAKLAAYEAGSVTELNKLERERIGDLEYKLSELVGAKAVLERQVVQISQELETERDTREAAEELGRRAEERVGMVEALHSRTGLDYEELLGRTRGLEGHSAEALERAGALEARVQALASELEDARAKALEGETERGQYIATLEELQQTINLINARADEAQRFWDQARVELESERAKALELGQLLEARSMEVEGAKAKVEKLEGSLEGSRRENSALRAVNERGLAELVAAARSNKADGDGGRGLEGKPEASDRRSVTSGELEMRNLKALHEQSRQKLDGALVELTELKTRNLGLERELVSSKSEIGMMRFRCAQLVGESKRIKSQISLKEWDLKEKVRLTEAAEVKASMLKNLMAENGLLTGGAEDEMSVNRSFESHAAIGATSNASTTGALMLSGGSGSGANDLGPESSSLLKRVRELELRLEQRAQAQRQLESQHEDTQKEMQAAEEKYRDAHRKHEAAADEIASLVQEVQRLRSGGASSVSPASAEGHGKVEEELQVLQERHRTLEQTHIKAVQYVKGMEKMLRRMKDELSKYKEKTESLEAELGEVRKNAGGGRESMSNETNMTNELRQQLGELTDQLESLRRSSKQSNLENEELQRRMSSLQAEYEKDMASYEQSAALQLRAVRDELADVQSANEKLQMELSDCVKQNQSLNAMVSAHRSNREQTVPADEATQQLTAQLTHAQKQVDWLTRENGDLQARCRDAEAKISLLLDHMENHSGASSPTPHDGTSTVDDPSSRFQWESKRRSSGLESIGSDFSAGYGALLEESAAAVPSTSKPGSAQPKPKPTSTSITATRT